MYTYTNQELNLLEVQFKKLDNAMLYQMNAFVLNENEYTFSKMNTLRECEGIALSAFWLNMIGSEDYLQICRILSACSRRIEKKV